MDNQVHNSIVSFIWGIADDCLRDVYVRGKYRDVILPMTVIRRLDALLEDSKDAVLEMKKRLDAAKIDNQWPALCNAAGQAFCNASPYRLRDLTSRAKKQTLKADFIAYLDGFSPNVQVILDKFKFRNQIDTMVDADILGAVIEKFVSSDINLSPNPVWKDEAKTIMRHPGLDNHGMGTIFEELIRRFNEENNEEAGEHWTPRDVVELMADLVFIPIADQIQDATYSCYDGACGTGGMLTVAQDRLLTLAHRRGNETYTGVAVFQKTYKDDQFNSHVNHGERGMYRIEGHHDPIVSEEVFLAANTAVDNNAKEKGMVRNSGKYSVRYALSGKIFCGECGGKCKRKKIYGDIWYGCETHARESKKCRQLPVRADMVEAAFVNMMNKLIYGRDAVLLPMSGRLLGGGDKEIIDRLAEINTELDAVAERRQAADKFFAKGLLDAAVYREELDELARKEKELHTVRAGIEGDPNLDSDRQRALNELLRYTAKAELLTAFSDEVFTKHVDRVIIFSRKEVGFAMKCGPVFRERI